MRKYFSSSNINTIALAAICAIVGIGYLVITPPMQVPDEQYHFYRAFQISEGTLFSERKNDISGGELPESLTRFYALYSNLMFRPDKKVSPEALNRALDIDLNEDQRKFIKFESTAIFPFPAYLVPATAISITKYFDSRPIILFYAARIANLIFGIFVLSIVFRVFKETQTLFVFSALLPMYMFELASVSSDSFSNSVAFLFIALTARAMQDQHFLKRAWPAIFAAAILVVSSKQTYSPVLLLLLLIPPSYYVSHRQYLVRTAMFYTIAAIVFFLWAAYARSVYVPLTWHPGANAEKQISHMIEYPYDHMMVFVTDIYWRWFRYVRMWIGELLGWVDTKLPYWLIISYLLVIPFLFIQQTLFKISILQRIGLVVIAIIGLFLVEAAIYIHTAPIASTLNDHIHGRYLIPYFLLLGLAMLGWPCLRKIHMNQNHIKFMIVMISICGSVLSLWTIHSRYYT